MHNKPASETTALVTFIIVLALIIGATALHGCSVLKTPVGESWSFLLESAAEIEVDVVMPDGTKARVKYRRNISPDAEAMRELGKGIAEGAVKGAIGGER